MNENKKKNTFWIVLISGIIVVTIISIFLGSRLAGWFTSRQAKKIGTEYTTKMEESENEYETSEKEIKEEGEGKEHKPGYLEPIPKEMTKGKEKSSEGDADRAGGKEEAEITESTSTQKIESNQGTEGESEEVIEVEKDEIDKKNTNVELEAHKEPQILYHIQLGIFKSKENALKLKNELSGLGQEVYVGEFGEGEEKYYRVQVGAFKDKEKAEKLARELRFKGYHVYISTEVK